MSTKINLIYISPDPFFDTDLTILNLLSKRYNVIWYAILFKDNVRYTNDYLLKYANENDIEINICLSTYRRRNLKQFFFDLQIINQIIKRRADLIYSSYTEDLFWNIIQMFKFKKSKTIIAIHDVEHHPKVNNFLIQFSIVLGRKILMLWGRKFHVFSKSEYTIFKNRYPDKECVYTQMGLKDFGQSKFRPISKSERCDFLFFGTIEYYKGLDTLIAAVEHLVSGGYTNFRLTIAGKGKYWNECKQKIKSVEKYNLLIQFISEEDASNLFCSHHFLVLPYRQVTQSGPHMIAYNYNLPVIATNFGGFRELIVDNENGFLFEYDDIFSLKRTLEKCINMSIADYDKLRFNLKEFVESNFSQELILNTYSDMIDSVAKGKKS